MLLAEIVLLVGLCFWVGRTFWDRGAPPNSVDLKVQLRGAQDHAYLYQIDGSYRYRIEDNDGRTEELDPQQFAQRLYGSHTGRSRYQRWLNVTSLAGVLWVAVGLLGQVLFTGRMVVQWLVSERHQASVVPPMFWWMSLIGSTMLLLYFMWRLDPVGVLGQGVGWFIYIRNLWLIYRPDGRRPSMTQDPAPQPELAGE